MNYRLFLITLSCLFVCSCSLFHKKQLDPNYKIRRPPRQESGVAVVPRHHQKQDASSPNESGQKYNTSPRIEEYRGNGGKVVNVKVNNHRHNLPPYYLSPNDDVMDSNAPSSDTVTPPHWQVTW